MANNQVSVEITLEEKAALKALTSLTRQVQTTEDSFTKMGKKGDESLSLLGQTSKGVSDGFGSLVKGVTIANLASEAIIGTANAIKRFAVDSVNAAIESEQATNKLGQALRAVGAYSEQTVSDFLQFASALSQVTIHSDDAIVNQLALAKSFGASNEQAKQLVKAASEMAATFGGSLDQRVEQLGKTLQGTGGKLGQLIPGFKELTEAQLKSGEAIDFINSKYGGASANELDTYGGKLAQLTKSFSELQESIGGFVVDSGVSGAFDSIAFAINRFTQSLSDNRIEQERQAGGLTETTESLEQLRRKYEDLAVNLIDVEQYLVNPTIWDSLIGHTAYAKDNIEKLRAEVALAKKEFEDAKPIVAQGIANAPQGEAANDSGGISKEDQKLVDSRAAAYAQLEIAQAEYNARQVEASVVGTEITEENYAFELERLISSEQMKIEAVYKAEEEKALLITDAKTRQFTQLKIAADKEAALDKSRLDSKKKVDTAELALADTKRAALIGIMGSTFTLLATLAKDGSKEQFIIQKAAAVAEIAVAHGKALALIPAQTATIPYPYNLAPVAQLTAYVNAQTALGLATVAASAMKGFEHGGIVSGNSMTGDNIGIRVNSGEMILNRQQQTGLFNQINNGGSGGNDEILRMILQAIKEQPVTVSIDGRELARSVRSQVQNGFKLA